MSQRGAHFTIMVVGKSTSQAVRALPIELSIDPSRGLNHRTCGIAATKSDNRTMFADVVGCLGRGDGTVSHSTADLNR